LQNVQQRNEDNFRAARLRRRVPIGEGKHQAEDIGDEDAHERIDGVQRQTLGVLRNFRFHFDRPEPRATYGKNAKNQGADGGKDGQINQEGVGPA
jgi:hypothetical protein